MPLPFNIGGEIREREYGLNAYMPELPDWSTADSSLTYFQDLLASTTKADLGIRESGSLYDAIGGAAWGFTDMATAHLLRGSWAFDTGGQPLASTIGKVDVESKAGKYSEQIGQAAGFLFPMSKVAKGLRWGVQGTRYGARKIAGELSRTTADRLAKKGAVQFTSKKSALEAGGKSANRHFFEAVDDSFVKRWHGTSAHGKVDGFGSAFQKTADKNKFIQSVTTNFTKNLDDMAKARGVRLEKGVADDLVSIYSKYFTDPKKFPVSSVGEMVARKFGIEGRLATAYTHMFEEAVTFATFEGILETVDSIQQERPYDVGVPMHAAAMGHILGAIRFVPGGKKFGGTLVGQGGGVQQYLRMMRNLKPFKGKVDPRNDAHRRGAFKLWDYLVDGHPFRNGNLPGKMLREFGETHPLWKKGILQGKKKISINNLNTTNVHTILNKGTKQQKEAMGTIMRDSLDYLRSNYRREWLPQFMKEYQKDLVGSLPRMFFGGVAMSGGPGVMFDENIALEDKVFGIMLGGFMMRRGHELSTRRVTQDKNGKTIISFVEPSGFFGGKKQTAYGEHFERLNKDIVMMGGNPFIWGGYRDLLNGRGSPHMDTMDKLPVGETEWGKRIKAVMEHAETPSGIPIIQTDKPLKIFDRKPSDPKQSVEETYGMYIQAARNLVDVETNIKGWDNLSSAGKKKVAKALEKEGFKSMEDVLEARVADNADIISTSTLIMSRGLVENLREVNINREPDSNGLFRLPKLEPQGNLTGKELDAIQKYNDYLNIAEITGKVKIDAREELGSATNIITPETKGLDKFVEGMEGTHQNYSDFFGFTKESNYEIFPSDRTFIELVKIGNFFTNKVNSREILDFITGMKPLPTVDALRNQKLQRAKDLFTGIYQDGGFWRGNIQLPRGTDWRDINFVENLGQVAQLEMIVKDGIKGIKDKKDTSVPVDAVSELREIFKSEGINLFETSGRYTDVLLDQVKNDHLKRLIVQGGVWNKNFTKKIPIDETHMSTVIALRESGFINESLTMMKWGKFEDFSSQFLTKNKKTWAKLFQQGGKKDIEKLVTEMKVFGDKEGLDTTTITVKRMTELSEHFNDYVNTLRESKAHPDIKTRKHAIAHLRGDMKYIYDTLVKRIKPLIQDVKNGQKAGFLKLNPKDIVHLTPEGILALKQQMLMRDNLAAKTDMDSFIVELNNASINEAKRLKSFSSYLLKNMTAQNWKDTDSIKIMELAAAHRIWNPFERKFETESMDTATINNAIRKILSGMTRGNLDSNNTVESHLRRMERDSIEELAGAGDIHYQSITLGSLAKKYDFTEFLFKDGKTVEKGGVKTMDEQLNELFDTKYGRDNISEFMLHLVDAAKMKKLTGEQYTGDTDIVLRETAKAMLDMNNTVSVPILYSNLSEGSLTQIIGNKNKMRRNETYDSIVRAMGDTPGVTSSVQIIPEKFTDLEDRKIFNKETGKMEPAKVPTTRSLSKREGDAETGTYPNEARMNRILFEGNKAVFEEKFTRNEAGEPLHTEFSRGILYVPYAQKWGYRIDATPEALGQYANTFINKLIEFKVPKGLQKEWFRELFLKETKVDGKKEIRLEDSNLNDAISTRAWVEKIIDISTGMDMFGKNYINHKLYTLEAKDLGEMIRRGALFSNANSNTLRPDVLGHISTAFKRAGQTAEMQSHAKYYDSLIAGKEHTVVIQDEMINDQFDLFRKHKTEVSEAIKDMADGNIRQQLLDYLVVLEQGAERFNEKSGESPSDQDAGTVMRNDAFNALGALSNGTRDMNIGGIKVIMLRKGDDFFVNKTALTKNSAYETFFRNNKGVSQLTFTSGNKKIAGRYFGELANSINEVGPGWESRTDLTKMALRSEDFRVGFLKADKKEATLSPNTFLFVGKEFRNEAYDYYIANHVKDGTSRIARLSKIDNYAEAIAQNKAWNEKDIESSSEEWIAESGLASEKFLADANIIPQFGHQAKSWAKNIKTQIIDKVLRPKVNGGQFVSQGIGPLENVRNSVHYVDKFGRSRIHRLGEFYGPHSLRTTPIDRENTFFVESKDIKDPSHDSPESLISWKEMKDRGLATHEMFDITTETGVHRVHTKYKTRDVTPYGTVTKVALRQKKVDWYKSNNIGELNDRLPDGYQIYSYAKRDPVVGGDSVIPILLKREFKRERDGNTGSLNRMDGQVSAELDHDIDIVNVWFNGPRGFAGHIIERKGYVPYGTSPTKTPKTSMDGLRPFDVDSKSRYRGYLNDASILKGKLMNYSSILDWLYSWNAGEMPVLHTTRDKTKVSTQGFQVGKNLFAALDITARGKQEIFQRLRNDIQGIVDGTGGFDRQYYTKWERDFLFNSNKSVFRAFKSIDVPSIDQMRDLSNYDIKVSQTGQKLIIDHLITPYRNLKSLANSKFEGTRSKKIELDDLVRGVRQFDTDLAFANKNAQAAAKKLGYEDIKSIFNGWNYEARLFNKGDHSQMPIFDRLMAATVNMDFRKHMDLPRHGLRNPWEYADITSELTFSKDSGDFAKIWGKEFSNLAESQRYLKYLKGDQRSLLKMAGEKSDTNPTLSKSLYRKANKIGRIISSEITKRSFRYESIKGKQTLMEWDWKGKKFEPAKRQNREFDKMWKGVQKHWQETLIAKAVGLKKGDKRTEAIQNWHKANNTWGQNPKAESNILVNRKIGDKGLVVEAHPNEDMISALSAHQTFGILAHSEPYRYSTNTNHVRATHDAMKTEADNLARDYSMSYARWFKGNAVEHSPGQIEQEFMDRLDRSYSKYHEIGGEPLANNFLWQFMTPKFDLSKLVMSGGKTMFAPKDGQNWKTRVGVGLKFIARTEKMTHDLKLRIFQDYSANFNRSVLAFHHHKGQNDLFQSTSDIMKRNDETGALERRNKDGLLDIRSEFKLNPLDYAKEGTMEEILSEVHPGFEGMSVSMSYGEMLKMFGSGGLPQILDAHRAFYLPAGAVTEISRYGVHMSTSGYPAFLKARKMGISAYIQNEGGRTTLDPEGIFENQRIVSEYRNERELAQDINEAYAQTICNKGNGGL